jgi:hypothetical protein
MAFGPPVEGLSLAGGSPPAPAEATGIIRAIVT